MALDRFKKLVDCLNDKADSGCDCAVAFKEFECLAEKAVDGADIHAVLPRVAAHLDHCPDCREEFDALVAIIRAERENRIN
jgi:predicted anti-sigma-YlaC factor YlaD